MYTTSDKRHAPLLRLALAALAALLACSLASAAYKPKTKKLKDMDAAIKAVQQIAAKYPADDMVPLAEALCTRFRRKPEIYVGLAEAFAYRSGVSDTARAMALLARAMATDPTYAPAYIMRGDLAWAAEDTTAAEGWYRRAVSIAPGHTEGYRRMALVYRKTGRMELVDTLYRQCKKYVPAFPCNLMLATMYQNSNKVAHLNKAMQYYAVAESDSMQPTDYTSYAALYNMLAETQQSAADKYASYKKMADICRDGLAATPDNYYLLTAALQASLKACNQARGNSGLRQPMADSAAAYGSRLMQRYDGDTLLRSFDIMNYALALKYKGRYDDAVQYFQRVADFARSTDSERSAAMQNMGEVYSELGQYDRADRMYAAYIRKRDASGTLTFYDINRYAQMYLDKAAESNGAERVAAYMKADSIYGESAARFIEYADYAYYQQVRIRAQDEIDQGRKNALFLKPAKRLWSLLTAKPALDEAEKARLLLAAIYIGWYYTMDNNQRTFGKQFWLKAYEVSPKNANVRNVLAKVYKMDLPAQ